MGEGHPPRMPGGWHPCVGAHLLAAAGLLDGRTATTHWSTAAQLAAGYPAVTVDADPIFIRSGRVWTGAGISSCMDLALALVAEDHGEETALAVARQLVMYLKRQGGQSPFSVPLSRPATLRRDIDELRMFIADHLDGDLSAAVLARRMSLSERHFARVFRNETGTNPAAYVEAARVEAARRLLENTDHHWNGSRKLPDSAPRKPRTGPSASRSAPPRRPTAAASAPPRDRRLSRNSGREARPAGVRDKAPALPEAGHCAP